jgi:hypothetical protein
MLAVAGLLAVTTLFKLMDGRRMQLTELLREYATARMEWSRKRARAAKMARQVAKQNNNRPDQEPDLHSEDSGNQGKAKKSPADASIQG